MALKPFFGRFYNYNIDLHSMPLRIIVRTHE